MTANDMTELRESLSALAEEVVPRAGYPEVRQRAARLCRRRTLTAVLASTGVVVLIGAGAVGVGTLRGQVTSAPVGASPAAGAATPSTDPGRLLRCTPSELPLPAGANSGMVSGADPTGRYVAGAAWRRVRDQDGGISQPVVWANGKPQTIAVSAASASAEVVNSHGVVAGSGARVDAPYAIFSWLLRNGEVTDLNAPAGYTTATPTAINDRGDVVGFASRGTGADGDEVAVLWPAGGAARILAAPGPAYASGIADDGTVVGELTNGSQDIPLPGPANSDGDRMFAGAVSDDDATVAGHSYHQETGRRAPLTRHR